MSNLPFRIERFDKADLDHRQDVLDLARLVFPDTWQAIEKKWHWQYFENPHCAEAAIFVALSGNNIAGLMGCIPVRFMANGDEIDAAWMIDAMTHPDFRRMGLSMKLHQRIEDEFPLVLAKSVSDMILPLDEKRGYVALNSTRYMLRILDYRGFLKLHWKAPIPSLHELSAGGHQDRTNVSCGLVPIDRFGAEFDDLADTLKTKIRYAPHKDAAYLNWRYMDCPVCRYRAFSVLQQQVVKGFVVLRIVFQNGIKTGWIVDMSCDPGESTILKALLRGSVAFFKHEHVVCVYALATEKRIRSAFYRHRFLPWRTSARIVAKSDPARVTLFPEGTVWHLTEGDSDSELFKGAYS